MALIQSLALMLFLLLSLVSQPCSHSLCEQRSLA